MLKEKFFKLAWDLTVACQVNEQDAFLIMFMAQRLRVVKRDVVNYDGVLGSHYFKKSIMADGDPCALLKLGTDLSEWTFDAGIAGVAGLYAGLRFA